MTITKEGALASFYTVNKAPIKHLKVYFSPKQAGSGDASPENIREISGWNSVQIHTAGKNLIRFPIMTRTYRGTTWTTHTDGTIDIDGAVDSPADYNFMSNWNNANEHLDFYLKAGTYVFSGNNPKIASMYLVARDGSTNKDIGVVGSSATSRTFTLTQDTLVGMQVAVARSTGELHITFKPQLELIEVTKYEKPTYNTYNITFPSTIYGGYIDLITGELVQEQIGQTFKGSDADQTTELTNTNKFRFRFYKALKGNGATKAGITYCDRLQYQYHESDSLHYYFTANNSNGNAYVYLPKDFGDNDEVTIIASLYTPELIATLTPTELQTLIGQNNIWSNADRVEIEYDLAESNDELYRRRNIILQSAPHQEQVEDTIAHFNTDLNSSVTEAKFYFTPAQLAGTQSPSNIIPIYGYNNLIINISGKNMLNCNGISDGTAHGITFTQHKNSKGIVDYITCSGTMDTKNTFRNLTPINIGANDDSDVHLPYGHISFCTYGNNSNILPMRPDGGYGGFTGTDHGGINASANWYDWNTDIYNDRVKSWARIQVVPNEVGTIINENVYPMMCHYLDRGCEFEAYHGNNLIVDFPALGKNLLDITKTSKLNPGATGSTITISNGVISIDAVAGSARSYVMFSQEFSAGTYTIQAKNSGAIAVPKLLVNIEFNDSSYNSYYNAYMRQLSSEGKFTFTLTQTAKIGIVLPNMTNESGNPGTLYDIQLESGSTATSYEPYTNTVYGGYLDLINGKLIKEWEKTSLKNKSWYNYSGFQWFAFNLNKDPYTDVYCNCFTVYDATKPSASRPNECITSYHNGASYADKLFFWKTDGNLSSNEDFKNWMNTLEYDPYIIYKLKTPIEYPLTPQTLKTLKGTNNIWSNANGPVSITYWTH